jgi:non-homologous end joining protein Ku
MTIINIGFLSIPVCFYTIKDATTIHKKPITKNFMKDFYQYLVMKRLEHLKKPSPIISLKNKDDSSKKIAIEYFEKKNKISNKNYNKNFFLVPEAGAEYKFELLRHSMLSEKEIAVAEYSYNASKIVLILYPTKYTILAKTIF